MKRLCLLIICVLVLSACGNDETVAKTELKQPEAPVTVQPTAPVTEVTEVTQPEETTQPTEEQEPSLSDYMTENDRLAIYQQLMKSALDENIGSENYTVEIKEDSHMINVYYSMPGVALDAVLKTAANGGETPEEWVTMRGQMEYACKQWYDALSSYDLNDWNVAFYLLNDINTDNALLAVLNGITIMDALEVR